MSLHRRRTHPRYVPGCFGCKVSSLQLAVAPTNEAQARQHEFQTGFAAEFTNGDREAYVRLRANGEQPPRIAGSGHLERHAETSFEITTGHVVPHNERAQLNAALALCADAGMDPLRPAMGV